MHNKREREMLTLGTAKIETKNGLLVLSYMSQGSFLIGEQIFGDGNKGWSAALRFCRINGLRVLDV